MKWVQGRQGGGYEKLHLVSLPPLFDCYLIRYKEGAGVRFHTDHVRGRRHLRLNILLWAAREGGAFLLRGKPLLRFWRFCLFRPDRSAHAVEKVTKGTRLVLSFGTAILRTRGLPEVYY